MAHKTNPGSTFGERFSFARWYQSGHVRHETDAAFAQAVGRTKAAVSQWRKMKEAPPREITILIAQRTSMDAGWLLALPGVLEPPGFQEWLAIYRKGPGSAASAKKGRGKTG